MERQIQRAIDEGQFDNLEGRGKPIPDLAAYDPGWWARRWLQRERAAAGIREMAQRVRKVVPRLAALSATEANQEIARLNDEIEQLNRTVPPADRIPLLEPRQTETPPAAGSRPLSPPMEKLST